MDSASFKNSLVKNESGFNLQYIIVILVGVVAFVAGLYSANVIPLPGVVQKPQSESVAQQTAEVCRYQSIDTFKQRLGSTLSDLQLQLVLAGKVSGVEDVAGNVKSDKRITVTSNGSSADMLILRNAQIYEGTDVTDFKSASGGTLKTKAIGVGDEVVINATIPLDKPEPVNRDSITAWWLFKKLPPS